MPPSSETQVKINFTQSRCIDIINFSRSEMCKAGFSSGTATFKWWGCHLSFKQWVATLMTHSLWKDSFFLLRKKRLKKCFWWKTRQRRAAVSEGRPSNDALHDILVRRNDSRGSLIRPRSGSQNDFLFFFKALALLSNQGLVQNYSTDIFYLSSP